MTGYVKVIENNSSIYNNLLSLRMSNEIITGELQGLIETKGLQERVFHHLGTKTWFWKVEIKINRIAIEAIIICLPLSGSNMPESGMEPDYRYSLYAFNNVGLVVE